MGKVIEKRHYFFKTIQVLMLCCAMTYPVMSESATHSQEQIQNEELAGTILSAIGKLESPDQAKEVGQIIDKALGKEANKGATASEVGSFLSQLVEKLNPKKSKGNWVDSKSSGVNHRTGAKYWR